MTPLLPSDLAVCRALALAHAKSFSAGIRRFPPRERDLTYALYGFVRVPDDLIDEDPDRERGARNLAAWSAAWQAEAAAGASEDPVRRAMLAVREQASIPDAEIGAFLEAMRLDGFRDRYGTFEELRGYTYGSAAVIGRMVARIAGVTGAEALTAAERLGDSYQLVNFLRDVRADIIQRDRVYLPQELLIRHGVPEELLRTGGPTAGWRDAAAEFAGEARQLAEEGLRGAPALPTGVRRGVLLATRYYLAVLDEAERRGWDVFAARISLSKAAKLRLYLQVTKEPLWRSAP